MMLEFTFYWNDTFMLYSLLTYNFLNTLKSNVMFFYLCSIIELTHRFSFFNRNVYENKKHIIQLLECVRLRYNYE